MADLSSGFDVRVAGNGGFTVWGCPAVAGGDGLLAAFTTGSDLVDWLSLRLEDVGAGGPAIDPEPAFSVVEDLPGAEFPEIGDNFLTRCEVPD